MLPSPFTLPAGTLVYGTDLALGLTDFLQVGTNLWLDLGRVYNANVKASLIDQPVFAFALTGAYQTYNLSDFSALNPDVQVQAYQPGAVAAVELLPSLAWFVGGNLNFTQRTLTTQGVQTSGLVQGARGETDLTWEYSGGGSGKRKRQGNALSAGVSYDFSYKLYGVGLSHHWPGFHLGVHVYPDASENKVQPILAGGGSIQF